MVIGPWLEDELKKRRERRERRIVAVALEKAQKEGRAEGRAKGRAEERRRWQEWNRRREAAVVAGEEFTELPPGGDGLESQNWQQA